MTLSANDIRDLFADAKTTADVDDVAWRLTKKGEVPDFIAKDFWKWVVIEENGHKLEVLFAPTYFALGDDDDPWFVDRSSEALAQNVADKFDALIPTWKLLQAAQKQSTLKIPYIDVKARGVALTEIESPKASKVANEAIRDAYDKRGKGFGDELCLTWAKSFVVSADMDGSHLCIGGGSWDTSGTNYVQPPCSPHVVSYGDASQRIALVSRKCRLDGADADLRDDVAKSSDPKIWGLALGATKFDPVFPNTGASGTSKDSYVVTSDTGTPLGGKGGVVTTDSASAPLLTRMLAKLPSVHDLEPAAIGGAVGAGLGFLLGGLRLRPIPLLVGSGAGAIVGYKFADQVRLRATSLWEKLHA